MYSLKYTEILTKNRQLGEALAGPPYKVALLSNIVVYQLKDILECALRLQGVNAQVVVGEYDNIVQESIRLAGVDAAVIFWETANLTDGLHYQAEIKEPAAIAALAEQVETEITSTLHILRHVPLILFNRFSSLLFDFHNLRPGVLDLLSERLNEHLKAIGGSGLLLVDIDRIIAQTGLNAAADFRQFQSSKILYSLPFLKTYSKQVEAAFKAVTGRSRKVLVMDCDNTLWGGILGEDGPGGIKIGEGSREGRVFTEIQFLLKGLVRQGVLLALCSKNNHDEVGFILNNHPDMVLRPEDIAAQKINWEDKASNITALAAELNLGLDSFVFVDDSAFEIDLVSSRLPEVRCVMVPRQLYEYPSILRSLAGEFFNLKTTSEDSEKTAMYQQEQARRNEARQFASLEDYLSSLKLKITVRNGAAVTVSRAAQLAQKTNQFNLTTRRYTEIDIKRMTEDPAWLVFSFSVEDRHGGYGETGLLTAHLTVESGEARIDGFLISCRVLGRNVEYAFWDFIVQKLRAMGVRRMRGEYIRTSKNEQVSDFFPGLGFETVSGSQDHMVYLLDLGSYKPKNIQYIEVN